MLSKKQVDQVEIEVRNILANARVNILNEEVIKTRAKASEGVVGETKFVYKLSGHGISDPMKRNYFKRTRIPLLNKYAHHAELRRVRKHSEDVFLEVVA